MAPPRSNGNRAARNKLNIPINTIIIVFISSVASFYVGLMLGMNHTGTVDCKDAATSAGTGTGKSC